MKKSAREQLMLRIKKEPGNSELCFQLGLLIIEEKQERNWAHQAAEWIKRAIHLDPLNPVYHFELGNCYYQSGIWEYGAKKKYRTSIFLNYKVDECRKFIEEIDANRVRENKKSLASYLETLAKKPGEASSYSSLSIYYSYYERDLKKALEYSLRAFEIDPNNIESIMGLGRTYSSMGKVTEAVECFERWIRKEDERLKKQWVEEEAEDGEAPLDYNYQKEEIYHEIVMVYEENKQYDNAIKWWFKCIEKFEPSAANYSGMAECYRRMGDDEKALEPFKEAIRLEPDEQNMEAYDFLIRYYGSKRDLKQTLYYTDEALKYNPDSQDFYYYKGVHFELTGNNAEAIHCYKIALAYKPDYAPAYNNLSSIFLKDKQFDKGLEFLLNGLKANPDLVVIHQNLKKFYEMKGDLNAAKQHEERIQELQIKELLS